MLVRCIVKDSKRAPPELTVLILGLCVYIPGNARTERCSHVCNSIISPIPLPTEVIYSM